MIKKYCETCKAIHKISSKFCPKCGTKLSLGLEVDDGTDVIDVDSSDAYKERLKQFELIKNDLALFVGNNFDYYLNKWANKTLKESPALASGWNWSAFFGSIFWYGYRKMYGMVLNIIAALIAIWYLVPMLNQSASALRVGLVLAYCSMATMANGSYYVHVTKKIAKIKSMVNDSENQKLLLMKTGGTSWLGVLFAIIMVLVFLMLIASI